MKKWWLVVVWRTYKGPWFRRSAFLVRLRNMLRRAITQYQPIITTFTDLYKKREKETCSPRAHSRIRRRESNTNPSVREHTLSLRRSLWVKSEVIVKQQVNRFEVDLLEPIFPDVWYDLGSRLYRQVDRKWLHPLSRSCQEKTSLESRII